MSDSSKNKDNSSDGGDEAKKMVLRSATNSIRNKKWSEDVDEAEYELDSDGEDTDYGNSSRVSFFSSFSLLLRQVCSFSHLVLTARIQFQRGESRGRETRKGGRASTRQANGTQQIS